MSRFNASLICIVLKYTRRPILIIAGLSFREMSVSEYRETLTPSGERPSRMAMSGMLIKGPKRLSRYSSVVICKFAVFGEGLRILEGDWRIVKLAYPSKLPICSILVDCFMRLGSLGLAMLVLKLSDGVLKRPVCTGVCWCFLVFYGAAIKIVEFFSRFLQEPSCLEFLSALPTRSSARR